MRARLDLYDLFAAAHGVWVGWRCVHNGKRYTEMAVVVPDLLALPVKARVRVEGAAWRRP